MTPRLSHRGTVRQTSREAWGDEHGQITAALVVLMPACLLCVGLVVDGGRGLDAQVRAIGQAQQAARAGAQQLDLATYRTTGQLRLAPDSAEAAARHYLRTVDATGQATATPGAVEVTVTTSTNTHLLRLLGIDQITVTGHGRAIPAPDRLGSP